MLDFLFGDSSLYIMIIIAAIALLYFFAKFPSVRGLFYGVLYCAVVLTGIYSLGNLNIYYKTTGGIYGEITSIFKKNQVDVVQEKEKIAFDFKNVVLMKNSKGVYTASMTSDQILKLDNNQTYFIYVNGEPCTIAQAEQRDVYATYEYTFMERENGEYYVLADDVMTFYFAFYDNFSYLRVEVENGTNTYKLWNNYFNKNNFKVTIEKVDKSFYDTTEYSEIDIVLNGSVYKNVTIKNGATYTLPTAEEMICDDFTFNYWIDEQGNQITAIENISEDRTIIANVTNNYTVTYMVDGVIVNTQYFAEDSMIPKPEDPTKNGYTFLRWVDEDGLAVSFENLAITRDRTFTAVFERGYKYSGDAISHYQYNNTNYTNPSTGVTTTKLEFDDEELAQIYSSKKFTEMQIRIYAMSSINDIKSSDATTWGTEHYVTPDGYVTIILKPSTSSQNITTEYDHYIGDAEDPIDKLLVTHKLTITPNADHFVITQQPIKFTQLAGDTSTDHNYVLTLDFFSVSEIKLYTV